MAKPQCTVEVTVEPKLSREQIEAFASAARTLTDALLEVQRSYVALGAVLVELLKPEPLQKDHALTD